MVLYTIGHSTRPLGELAGLLTLNSVELLVDVRSYPGSRINPQFNKETISEALAPYEIRYEHIAELGGRRGEIVPVHDSKNGAWENPHFRNFADYALGEEFEVGYARLLAAAEMFVTAIMCSEGVWWRCHRRIISDYLLARGVSVLHILSAAKPKPGIFSDFAKVTDGKKVIYEKTQVDLVENPPEKPEGISTQSDRTVQTG